MILENTAASEVKEVNKEILSEALHTAATELLAQLERDPQTVLIKVQSQPFELIQSTGESHTCVAVIFYSRVPDSYKSALRISIIDSKTSSENLTFNQEIDFGLHASEIAMRTWWFRKPPKPLNQNRLLADSRVEVAYAYRQAGIGKALVQQGEDIKDSVVRKIAQTFEVTELQTRITDSSGTGWTTKRVYDALTGYHFESNSPQSDQDDNSYIKIEKL